jgi:acyl-coenzyme A thioesterase PaaI-like protein
MRFKAEGDDRVRGVVRFDRRQERSPGLAHGGAVAAALDDLLGTVLVVVGRLA